MLPDEITKEYIYEVDAAVSRIKTLIVRGAPCIAAVGCLSIVAELNQYVGGPRFGTSKDIVEFVCKSSDKLVASRPTAVNLKHALDRVIEFVEQNRNKNGVTLVQLLTEFCIDGIKNGERANRKMGELGAEELIKHCPYKRKLKVLTHCNTGALATVGHGTALGIIRSLHERSKLERAYCTETRPCNQGSRLTAWEFVQESIPAVLVTDSMVAYLMSTEKIDAVVVGADRVATNGDTANKIGTLQLAISAKNFKVPFFVAAPTQSIDLKIPNGGAIKIELRSADELRKLGSAQLAPQSIEVWNPSFDVTPSDLITGIITEFGCCKPSELESFLKSIKRSERDALY